MHRKPISRPLSLRIHPDSSLRQICTPVECFDVWLHDVLEEMLLLMRANNGIGLAGPQVGITQRLFVTQIQSQTICLANPEIVSRAGHARMGEGCLSLPRVQVKVERQREIDVQGYDFSGRKQAYRVQGLWARVIQHEIDHLDGTLITDYR